MENRYSNINQTAPVLSAMKNKKLPVPHSFFDLTRNVAFDCGLGWLVPFDLIETLPDSDYEISYDILAMTRNPLVRRLLNGCTIYVHTYGIACSDLWDGFPTFVSRGRSGTITRTVPLASNDSSATGSSNPFLLGSTPYSPSSFLGVPPRCMPESSITVSTDGILHPRAHQQLTDEETLNPIITFNCLPLVFYQQICVYNYMPSNLLQSNKHFYPDDEMHFKLSSTLNSDNVLNLSYDDEEAIFYDENNRDVAITSTNTCVHLNDLRVRQFQGDRFNTGLPFPELVRGDVPSLSLATTELTVPSGQALFEEPFIKSVDSNGHYSGVYVDTTTNPSQLSYPNGGIGRAGHKDAQESLNNGALSFLDYTGTGTHASGSVRFVADAGDGNNHVFKLAYPLSATGSLQTSITLSQLNALQVLTLMRQRAALSDGSYNELIRAQYNESPDLHVGKPFYIGGTKQPLIFNEVVQTSASESGKPLGSTGSRAVSAGNGYIGKYHSKDFGYIMSVLSVVPDVYYTQGLERLWSRVNQSQFHFPLMDNLAPDAILNKELFVSGNSAVDDDVFAYQERDSEYKSRPNVLRGGLAINKSGVNEDLKAYSMKRTFSSTPSLSYGMVGMFPSNMDYSVFSNSVDTPFIFSITSRVKATLPLPYVTMPNDGLTRIA